MTISELWLIRHGETEWTLSGRHTGRTDVPLTPRGREQGGLLRRRLSEVKFEMILTSPLCRARETCRIAGYEVAAQVDDDLQEWDYGAYEGRTTAEIRREIVAWSIWDGGVPGGETADQVGLRADRAISRALAACGSVAIFAHGHFLRILAARWLGLPAGAGRSLALSTSSVSILGHEREHRVLRHWNEVCHLEEHR